MKIFRWILIFIISFVVGFFIIGLFLKKDYEVKTNIVINQPKDIVFDYIKYLKNQEIYSVWYKADSNLRKFYRGEDAKVGFVTGWESDIKDVGKGEQEIKKIINGDRIDYELRFFEPFEATESCYMRTKSITDEKTLVEWAMKGSMPYPTNLWLIFMDIEEMLLKDLNQGLINLKKELENTVE